MKKIRGVGFRTNDKIYVKIDKFEEMVIEIENVRLAENIEYAVSLQFLERLEKCEDINAVEKMKLKDVIEDVNGEPKVGDTLEMLKKELRRMKVVENHEESLSKDITTY